MPSSWVTTTSVASTVIPTRPRLRESRDHPDFRKLVEAMKANRARSLMAAVSSLMHPLSTLAIDPRGRVTTIWPGHARSGGSRTSKGNDGGRVAGEPGSRPAGEAPDGSRPWGIDPWGQRFDGHQAIADVRAVAVPEGAGRATSPGPTVRVAGRIMLRRGQGKVNFLQLRDWTEPDPGLRRQEPGRRGRLGARRRARPRRPDRRRRHARLHQDRRADRLRRRR